jgi:hypothetical protein
LCVAVCFREGTGTKVVYGDFRRWLPLDHAFRTDADFGAPELRPSPRLRTSDSIRSEGAASSAARYVFGAKPKSVHDPARASGVSGTSEVLRDEQFDPVLQGMLDLMHIVVRCLRVCVVVAHCSVLMLLCSALYLQQGGNVHWVNLTKGVRTWDNGDVDAAGSEVAAAEAKEHGYLLTRKNQDLVEARLASLLFPPNLVSSNVRKIFKYTGAIVCSFDFGVVV